MGRKEHQKCNDCGAKSFVCDNCGKTGCRTKKCDQFNFAPVDKCRHCGRAHEMKPIWKAEAHQAAAAAPAAPGRRAPSWPIELYFLGGLIGIAVAIGLFSVLGSGVARSGSPLVSLPSIGSGSAVAISTPGDVCSCFNEGFDLAATGVGVLSSQYRTGFEQCRAIHGVEGGNAWTAGWNSRLSAKPYEASCRSYLRRPR